MGKLFLRGYVYLKSGLKSRKGQAMTEYGLIIALVAVVLIGVIGTLTGLLQDVFNRIVTALNGILHPAPPSGG